MKSLKYLVVGKRCHVSYEFRRDSDHQQKSGKHFLHTEKEEFIIELLDLE
jgi:hypothetical protein